MDFPEVTCPDVGALAVTGAVQDAQLFLTIGYRVAMAAAFPQWRPGNEFKAIRDKQLKP